jgi:hypothetical protein
MDVNKVSIEILLALEQSRFQRAAIKLTHMGEQTEAVGTVVMQSYYYLPPLELFRALRTPGLPYENDELPITLNFSITPAEVKVVLEEARRVWNSVNQPGDSPSLSFTGLVDAPEGIQGTELLFSYQNGVALHRALAGAIDQDNKIGQMVLRNQRESAYSGA